MSRTLFSATLIAISLTSVLAAQSHAGEPESSPPRTLVRRPAIRLDQRGPTYAGDARLRPVRRHQPGPVAVPVPGPVCPRGGGRHDHHKLRSTRTKCSTPAPGLARVPSYVVPTYRKQLSVSWCRGWFGVPRLKFCMVRVPDRYVVKDTVVKVKYCQDIGRRTVPAPELIPERWLLFDRSTVLARRFRRRPRDSSTSILRNPSSCNFTRRTGRCAALVAGLMLIPALSLTLRAADDRPTDVNSGEIITAAGDDERDTAPTRSADATEDDLTGEDAAIVQTGHCRHCRLGGDPCGHRFRLFGWFRGGGSGHCRVSDVAYPYQPGYPGDTIRTPATARRPGLFRPGLRRARLGPARACVKYAYNYGWGIPASRATPVGTTYNRWYPNNWYSFSGPGPMAGMGGGPNPPVIYSPTDTSQSGFYYRHVPRWQPVGYFPGY